MVAARFDVDALDLKQRPDRLDLNRGGRRTHSLSFLFFKKKHNRNKKTSNSRSKALDAIPVSQSKNPTPTPHPSPSPRLRPTLPWWAAAKSGVLLMSDSGVTTAPRESRNWIT